MSNEHVPIGEKFVIPDEVFTSSDPNFWDYVRLKDITKNTGIEPEDFHSFCLKELLDNAADFLEKYYTDASIIVSITRSKDWFRIAVRNSNVNSIPVFTNLAQSFNYKRAYSSKSNQYRVTRGAQGDAIKKMSTMPYALDNKWNEPLIIQHNKKSDKVYVQVDRKYGEIRPKFLDSIISDDVYDTEITLTLPPIEETIFKRFKQYCLQYTLFNTHISYLFYFDHELVQHLDACHPMVKDYDNPNSIYCYSDIDFGDFLNDIYDKKMSVYDAINKSAFREIRQPGRFDNLKHTTLEQLRPDNITKIYRDLKKSMLPMSKVPVPYDTRICKRKQALVNRFNVIKPPWLQIDTERTTYQKTDATYESKNEAMRFPFSFEVLAIPIISGSEKSILISGVNYSTSVNNKGYFEGRYTNTYQWIHNKTEKELEASDIIEILRKAAVGDNIGDESNIPAGKQRQQCVIIAHLVCPRIEYISYGKSSLTLEPFAQDIAETIEKAVSSIPLKSRYTPGIDKPPSVTACLRKLLQMRWEHVKQNPGILDPSSKDYDAWSQSTVWYNLRKQYLLPLEGKFKVTIIKENTRDDVTAKISDICENYLDGHPKREELGIFASPRATMYADGSWYNVDIDAIPSLAEKGTDVVFIEKRGAVEIVKYIGDIYGIAFVNTQGHFAEYPKDLIREINENGGNVAILTDFDCVGIHIAEKVIAEDMEDERSDYWRDHVTEGIEEYSNRIVRLGIDVETLAYFLYRKKNIDGTEDNEELKLAIENMSQEVGEEYPKHTEPKKQQPGKNVITPIIEYVKLYHSYLRDPKNSKLIGYKRYDYIADNFEYLTGIDLADLYEDLDDIIENRKMAQRIEIDSVIEAVKPPAFAQYILDKLQEFFPYRNYNRVIKPLTEYFGDKFDVLPESTKKLLLHVKDIAEAAAKPTEEAIESEQEKVEGLLHVVDTKEANKKRVTEAIAQNVEMKALDSKLAEVSGQLDLDKKQ